MNIREMRKELGETQKEFADRYGIPFRSIQNWETGSRKPPEYILNFLNDNVKRDLINRRTIELPKYDSQKIDLPKREEYLEPTTWLEAVNEFIDEEIVFALNDALMCGGYFQGYLEEKYVWVYGSDSLQKYNGIVILGNNINPNNISEIDGLKFTDINRTLFDALSNESILDMQGITEAISKYYYTNAESFTGLDVYPGYENRFVELAQDAIEYYDY